MRQAQVYWTVGDREDCGHRHRTWAAARRCAPGHVLAHGTQDLRNEARELGIPWPQYRRDAILDAIQEIHET